MSYDYETADEHGTAQPQSKGLTAETLRTRRFRPWERTLPACPRCLTPCTQDVCAPRSTHMKILGSLQKIFGLVVQISTAHNSVICVRSVARASRP